MKARIKILSLVAVLALGVLSLPASAGHALNFDCPNPSPNTAGSNANSTCTFTTHKTGTRVSQAQLDLPVDAKINEVGTHDGADPANNAKVGTSTVSTDLNYDGCGDANDGGTYSTYYRTQPNWTAFSVPAGWTKVAEFRTEFVVLFFFTEQVPTHVIKNNTTGQYRTISLIPSSRGCDGAVTNWSITTYGHVDQNTSKPWVGRNPSTAGTYTVTLTVSYTDGTTATDSDDITIV